MPDRIIISQLREHRRLVVPRLGVFLVRDDGRVLFSELLRNDDGVLRSLLISERGVGEIEAAGVIDRFVFEVRHTIDHGKEYRIGSLGSLRRNEQGAICFTPADEDTTIESADAGVRPQIKSTFRPTRKPEGLRPPRPFVQDLETPAPAQEPEPEPQNEPVSESAAAEPSRNEAESEKPTGRRRVKKPDLVFIIAVAVILAAVAVIIYGYFVASLEPEIGSIEQVDDAAAGEVDLSIPSDGGKQ